MKLFQVNLVSAGDFHGAVDLVHDFFFAHLFNMMMDFQTDGVEFLIRQGATKPVGRRFGLLLHLNVVVADFGGRIVFHHLG